MIDLHNHILPAIDDGPPDLATSLEMARIAVSDGIRRVVATPHVVDAAPSPERIREEVGRFQAALEEAQIPLEVLPGAEVAALGGEARKEYAINGGGYLLLEFSHSHLPQNAGQVVFNALLSGLTPIIAHPERNPSVLRRPQLLLEMVEGGALVQITAASLTGGFGPDSRQCARFLLKKGAVHFLASDAHSPRQRPPVLSEAFKAAAKIVGKEAARRLVSAHPAAVIAGTPIDA